MMFGSHIVRRGTGSALAASLFVISLLYLTLSMDRGVNVYDESIMLFGADRVLHGDVPHRDFYALYGPGQFYVLAGLYKLFGASVLIERVWNTIVSACSVVLIFLIVNRVAPSRLAVLAAVAALPWFQNNSIYGTSVIPCMAAMLASLLFLAPALGRTDASPRLLGAGACVGVVALFRYDIGFATLGAECALIAVSTWFERPAARNRPRAVVLSLIVFGGGFAIVALPVAVAYAVAGVLPDLYFDAFAFPASAYARTRALPLPRLSTLMAYPTEFVGVYLPMVLCALAVPAIFAAAFARRSALQWTLLALTVLEAVWFAKGFVRASVIQMSMALVLSAPLAVVLAHAIRGRGRLRTAIAVAALVVCLGETIAWEPPALAMIGRNLTQPPNCRPPPGLGRIACFELPLDDVKTVQYVQQHTAPDDPVFVGVARHDKIFVNDVALYFAMNRRSATKWHHFDPGLQTSAPIQQEIVGELQRGHTRLLVIDARWEGVHEPNDSAVSSGVTILDDYIRQAYAPVATFGAITIMQAKTP
jgi:hypothetical protein